METALLPVVALLAAGIQLIYSSSLYAAGIVMNPPTDENPAPLTPAQKRNLPRVSKRILPQGAMINKFSKDYHNTTYPDPNPAARFVNPDATLPPSFYDVYLERLSRTFAVKCIGANQRYWTMDPNLKVAQYIPPRLAHVSADIQPVSCPSESTTELQLRSRAKAHHHLPVGCK